MDDARLQFSIVHHLSEVLFPAIPFVTTGKRTPGYCRAKELQVIIPKCIHLIVAYHGVLKVGEYQWETTFQFADGIFQVFMITGYI